ncbi:AAA family ATPase [bacterium]|nr:AAA family ATPase [bacterium]
MDEFANERLRRAASRQGEFELIGSLLQNADAIDDVAAAVQPEYFASEPLRAIYGVLLRLRREDRPTAVEAVAAELGAESGIIDALEKAYGLVAHGLHADHYARQVKAAWLARSFGYVVTDTSGALAQADRSPDEVLNEHARQIERLLDADTGDGDGHISEHLLAMDTETVEKFTTGLDDLDMFLHGGFGAGQLVCVGARPSVGKTAFCSGVALSVARTGIPVLALPLEMTRREMTNRLRCQAGIRSSDDVDGLNELAELPFYIREAAGWSIDRIEAEARRYSRRHGVRLLIVDYLSLVRPRDNRPPKWERVADISRSLKLLAMRTGLAVVAAQQLSREIEKRQNPRPLMSDFADSGSIEQDADVLIGLDRPVRPDDGDRTDAMLYLMKNRHGETANLRLSFDPARTLFAQSQTWPIDGRAIG